MAGYPRDLEIASVQTRLLAHLVATGGVIDPGGNADAGRVGLEGAALARDDNGLPLPQPAGRSNGLNAAWPCPAGRRWTRLVLNLASSDLCPRYQTNPNRTEERWAQKWAHDPLRGSAI